MKSLLNDSVYISKINDELLRQEVKTFLSIKDIYNKCTENVSSFVSDYNIPERIKEISNNLESEPKRVIVVDSLSMINSK